MLTIEIGDVVNTKSIRAEMKRDNGTLSASFSAGRSNEFVVLFLGKETPGHKVDPEFALHQMGWFAGLDSDDAKALIKIHEKEIKQIEKANAAQDPKITYDSRIETLKIKVAKLARYVHVFDTYLRA
jgi:hypothetical protein